MSSSQALSERLTAFLLESLGAWPPPAPLFVATSAARRRPGWDGRVRPFSGVSTPTATVVSVPEGQLEAARRLASRGRAALESEIAGLLGRPAAQLRSGVFRAVGHLVDFGAPGEWVAATDPRLPQWLHAFSGEVLVAFDERGRYAAGVGLKRHSSLAQEIAVGTEPAQRGRGLARALVAQAARRIYDEGATATYLHATDNAASGAVATAAGFPDLGWRTLGLSSEG